MLVKKKKKEEEIKSDIFCIYFLPLHKIRN